MLRFCCHFYAKLYLTADDKNVESRKTTYIYPTQKKRRRKKMRERIEDQMVVATGKMSGMLRSLSRNKKAVMLLKIGMVLFMVAAVTLTFTTPSLAAGALRDVDVNLDPAVHPVLNLINKLVNPLMLLVGAGGVIFCIIMGVKYATAEEPQEREKRKQHLKNAIIGYLLIFVLVVILKLSIGPLTNWMVGNTTATTATTK